MQNLNKLKKTEILDIFNFRCEHRHNGFEHPVCYARSRAAQGERTGFFDIESSGLKGNFNFMLSWAIKDAAVPGKKGIKNAVLTKEDIMDLSFDKGIVSSCIKEMMQYDKLVTHYGTGFDIPFIRTRALWWKKKDPQFIDFPEFGTIIHSDVYYMAKRALCLHSNRQDCVAEAIQGGNIKTRIHPEIWMRVIGGAKDALEYIVDHNIKDVLQLEGNFNILRKYMRETRKSI
jgi:uncharacterized protein YprB with RNaseH-like and TPR domain